MAVRTVVQHGSDGGVSRQRPLNGPTVAPLPLTPLPKAPVALPLPSQQPVPSHPNPCLSRQEGYDPSMMIKSHCLHPNSIHPPTYLTPAPWAPLVMERARKISLVCHRHQEKNRQGINTCLKSAKLCYYPSPPTTRQLPTNYPPSQAALMLSYFRLFSPIQCLFLPWKSSSIPSSSEESQKAGARLLEVVS